MILSAYSLLGVKIFVLEMISLIMLAFFLNCSVDFRVPMHMTVESLELHMHS